MNLEESFRFRNHLNFVAINKYTSVKKFTLNINYTLWELKTFCLERKK
jgi:hypothetical protein